MLLEGDLRRGRRRTGPNKRVEPASIPGAVGASPTYSDGVKIRPPPPPEVHAWRMRLAALVCLLLSFGQPAAQALADPLVADLQRWALDRATDAEPAPGARVAVTLGQLDPRLRLAPCARIEPYLPAGSRPWGRTRIGLRCAEGPTLWNVSLPMTVQVFAPALVLQEPLPAGAELSAAHLVEAEVDWAERSGAPWTDADALAGRRLSRALAAGQPVREADLQRRVWFAAGERVRVTAVGPGYRVSTQGQALSRGFDGSSVRVRTDGGRVLVGTAVADHHVELPL